MRKRTNVCELSAKRGLRDHLNSPNACMSDRVGGNVSIVGNTRAGSISQKIDGVALVIKPFASPV